jgi:hypothetical protein
MDWLSALVAFGVGLGGVAFGGFLTRRNDRKGHADRLLTEAFNDALSAITDVAGGVGDSALRRYASATSRIALHAPPRVVVKFRRFQDDATTFTADGRARFIAAVQEARRELGHGEVDDDDLGVLLFGGTQPRDNAR